MIFYRLAHASFADDLSGIGAEKFGGRWNSKGNAAVYAAEHLSLSVLEVAVHTTFKQIPSNYRVVQLEVPDDLMMTTLPIADLDENWRIFPSPFSTQQIGNQFLIKKKTAILKVPSAVVPSEYNVVLNPHHPDFKAVQIKAILPFDFDVRLFREKI
jgi:RES domain-containing protein